MYSENYKRFLELIDKLREFEGALIVEGMRDEVASEESGGQGGDNKVVPPPIDGNRAHRLIV